MKTSRPRQTARVQQTPLAERRTKLRRIVARLDRLLAAVNVRRLARADWTAAVDAAYIERDLRHELIRFANSIGNAVEARR